MEAAHTVHKRAKQHRRRKKCKPGFAWPFCVSKKRKGYPIGEGRAPQGTGHRAQGTRHRPQATG